MLTRNERIKNASSFIRKSFGVDTYETINRFNINAHYSLLCIKLYGILIKRLDERNIPNTFSEADLVRVKQSIVLDVIMKTEILIESTLVLFHALSKGYRSVPKTMTYYDFKLIRPIIEKIKRKEYNMIRILGLPNLKTLPISNTERKFLAKLFSKSADSCYAALQEISSFYEQTRIIYGKSKHGLSFRLGMGRVLNPNLEPQIPEFNESILEAIDRKNKGDMPPGYILSRPINQSGDINHEFYNAISILKFSKDYSVRSYELTHY